MQYAQSCNYIKCNSCHLKMINNIFLKMSNISVNDKICKNQKYYNSLWNCSCY